LADTDLPLAKHRFSIYFRVFGRAATRCGRLQARSKNIKDKGRVSSGGLINEVHELARKCTVYSEFLSVHVIDDYACVCCVWGILLEDIFTNAL